MSDQAHRLRDNADWLAWVCMFGIFGGEDEQMLAMIKNMRDAADEIEKLSDAQMRCNICGFIVQAAYEAEKPTVQTGPGRRPPGLTA